MKLFDIVGGKVTIHTEALGLPFFKDLWDNNKDKDLVTRYISYIVLKNKYDSPYVKSTPADQLESKVKKAVFYDEDYQLPTEVLIAEEQYNTVVQDSLALRLLMSSRKKLDSIREYYDNSLDDILDDKKVKDITAAIGNLDKTISSLDKLESSVRANELSKISKVRGDEKINPYELVN